MINQSGGVNYLTNGNALLVGSFTGYTGTYNLSGTGAISAGGGEYIGYASTATFTQTVGTNAVFGSGLLVGSFSGATGNYSLSGTGMVSASEGEFIGYEAAGAFNQTGGTNNSSYLYIGYGSGSTGTYTLSAGQLNVNGYAIVGGSGSGAAGSGSLAVSNTGSLSVTQTLTVWTTGQVALKAPLATVGGLSIVGNGFVNLDGALVINYASPFSDPVATIAGYLATGAHISGTNDSWTGLGINSSSAAASNGKFLLGYLDGDNANDSLYNTVSGNQIIVAYTIAGDAFLEGSVGFRDLLVVAQNYQQIGRDYAQGDFNYDPSGSVGFADLLVVAQNYGQTYALTTGGLGSGGGALELGLSNLPSPTPIPEPSSALLFASIGAMAIRRHRKRC